MNEVFMLLRRRRGVIEVLSEHGDDNLHSSVEAFIDRVRGPEESCWGCEREELLTAAINRLEPEIRRMVLFHNIEERSAEDTAQILGISIAAVKHAFSQARRKLRRTLNPEPLLGAYGTPRAKAQCY